MRAWATIACLAALSATVGELIRGVKIALIVLPTANCPAFDTDRDGQVSVSELIRAVGAALDGCSVRGTSFSKHHP